MLATLALLLAPPAPQDPFEAVAPVLERACLRCHDADAREGGLSLETRAEALSPLPGKGPAIVPGDAAASWVLELVDPVDPYMPAEGDPLTEDEVAALAAWIEAGAPWAEGRVLRSAHLDDTDWWSLRPLVRPDVPETSLGLVASLRNEVDAFVLARLEAELGDGAMLAPEAPRRTLIRRLTFDLHGLPPTPEEVLAFERDERPDAYERLVDRLLASPRYGERQAQHWLDVARYADTHGYDKDKPRRSAWPYRDWVVDAFNDGMRWDHFVRRQVAGDVLEARDPGAVIATGFLAAGPWDFVGHVEVREGTVEKARVRNLDRDEVVSAVMSAFTSTTVHCARCHDHEFDPIDQEDYYALQAVFAGVERAEREVDLDPRVAAQRRALAWRVDSLRPVAQVLRDRRLTAYAAEVEDDLRRVDELLAAANADAPPTIGWHSAIHGDPDAGAWVQVDLGEARAVEEVWLVPAHVAYGGHPGPGFGFATELRVEASADPGFSDLVYPLFDTTGDPMAHPGDVPLRMRVPRDARVRYVRVTAPRLWERTSDWILALRELIAVEDGVNVAYGAAVTASGSIEAGASWGARYLVDDARAASRLAGYEEARALAAAVPDPPRGVSGEERDLAEIERALAELPPPARTYAVASAFAGEGAFSPPPDGRPRPIHLLRRGDVEQPVRPVGPGALAAVAALPARFDLADEEDEGERRRALADWLTHPDHPLTWRSAANRAWQALFGRGLVATPNDFGRMGEAPSHPLLLDWLAAELRDGASVKELHRLLVTSATYRQPVLDLEEVPDHLHLGRARRRLDAEELRDALLAVSGRLDLTMGGPGYETFAFEDDHSPRYLYDALAPDAPGTERRAVYRFVVRSVSDPFLATFDCPDATASAPERVETTTPLQALALWNDPFALRQCEHLAARLRDEHADPGDQVTRLVELAWGRPPTGEEFTVLLTHVIDHDLESACRVVVNAAEFLYLE